MAIGWMHGHHADKIPTEKRNTPKYSNYSEKHPHYLVIILEILGLVIVGTAITLLLVLVPMSG